MADLDRCQMGGSDRWDQQVSPPLTVAERGTGKRKKGKARKGSSAQARRESQRKESGEGEI